MSEVRLHRPASLPPFPHGPASFSHFLVCRQLLISSDTGQTSPPLGSFPSLPQEEFFLPPVLREHRARISFCALLGCVLTVYLWTTSPSWVWESSVECVVLFPHVCFNNLLHGRDSGAVFFVWLSRRQVSVSSRKRSEINSEGLLCRIGHVSYRIWSPPILSLFTFCPLVCFPHKVSVWL